MDESTPSDRLYLDDLHVGQRFTSETYTIDEEKIRAFAIQFGGTRATFSMHSRRPRLSRPVVIKRPVRKSAHGCLPMLVRR